MVAASVRHTVERKKKTQFRRHMDAFHTEANTHTRNQLLNFVLDSLSVRLRMLFVCSITIYSRKCSLLLCPMTERKWECNLCQNDLFFVRNEMLKHRTNVIACGCWAISNVNRGKFEYPLITMRAVRKNKIEKKYVGRRDFRRIQTGLSTIKYSR